MLPVVISLYVLSALGPVLALIFALKDSRLVNSYVGYDRSDFLNNPDGVALQSRGLVHEVLLVGGGVVLAAIAGILSLFL